MNVSEIILSAIETGKENAVHLSELMRLCDLNNRETRRIIESLRISGAVICSDRHGFYMPADYSELAKYIKQETARSRSIYRRTASARRQLKKWAEMAAFDGASLLDGEVNNNG